MRVPIKNLEGGDGHFIFYTACGYRWVETCDPQKEDLSYHLTEDAAMEAVKDLKLSVGFQQAVESHIIAPDLEEGEDHVTLDVKESIETNDIFWGDVNDGESIEGAIIIRWSWERHVGYCRNLLEIGIGGEYPFSNLKTESDLLTGNEDSTFRENYSVLVSAKEVEKCLEEGVQDLMNTIAEELNRGYWKWNHFKNNPKSGHIEGLIEERIEKHFETK